MLPGKIIVKMSSDVTGLPSVMENILNAGLEISKVEITKPDLADVFALLTGTSLEYEQLRGVDP